MISFEVDPKTHNKIASIVRDAKKRGVINRLGNQLLDPDLETDIKLSLCACIAQGQALDLDQLAGFDDFNLAHDLLGINHYIDKDDDSPTAGQLLNHFLPRCAK